MDVLKVTTVSQVWRQGEWVYKRQPRSMAINEMWALEILGRYKIVPMNPEWVDGDTIRMAFVPRMPILNVENWLNFETLVLKVLFQSGVRHGDLTAPNIIPYQGRPVIIDWGDCRPTCDPREDKRPEGDAYWLHRALREIVGLE